MQREFLEALGRPFGGDELFDEVRDTVYFVKNEAGLYVFVNETLVKRCGLEKKEDLLGKSAGEVFPSPLGQDFQSQDEVILAGGAAIRNQLERHMYPDGNQGWCLTWKRALRSAEGEIIGLSGISRDVGGETSSARDLGSIAVVLEYIREHLDQPLRLSDLAEAAGLSPYQVSQRLEGLLGLTPKQYIRRCRIEAACHALETSKESLSEIALACGFSDQSSFTRQFGQTVGMTPKVYRDRALGSR
jgi:PAS domain S-box-containing protein